MTAEPETGWTTLARTEVYRGRTVIASHTVRTADGAEAQYEVDESIPYAVATLIVDGDAVILTRQYRYPLGRWIHDLPGGAGELGERPIDSARREVEEELGLIPLDLQPLHTFYTNPGRASWPVHVFICAAGTSVGRAEHSDPLEHVRPVRMPVAELDVRIARGDIVDPTLIVARAAAAASGALPPLGAVAPG